MGVVVIYHVIRLEQIVGVALDIEHIIRQVHALEAVENRGIDGTVDQPARGHPDAFHHKVAVRGVGIDSATRQFNNHARAPWVAAQQPVAQGTFHFFKLAVPRQLAVQDALGEHRCGQVVAAPDARHAPQEGVARLFSTRFDTLDTRLDVADKLGLKALIAASLLCDTHVTHVHERVPLVVAGTVGSHPWSNRFTTAIFHRLGEIVGVTSGVVEFDGAQFHVINPIVLLVDVGRDDAHRLGVARLVESHLIGVGSLRADFGGKIGIIGLQHLCP